MQRRILSSSAAGRTPGRIPSTSGTSSLARFATAPQIVPSSRNHHQNLAQQRFPLRSSSQTSIPISPNKQLASSSKTRPPSSSSFNPSIPKLAPYPRPVRQTDDIVSGNGSPLANPLSNSGRSLFNTSVPEENVNEDGESTPQKQPGLPKSPLKRGGTALSSALFSIKTRSGALVELDPNVTPGRQDDLLKNLTDSTKRQISTEVMKLAEVYGRLNV